MHMQIHCERGSQDKNKKTKENGHHPKKMVRTRHMTIIFDPKRLHGQQGSQLSTLTKPLTSSQ
jgi:hypothetical protein